jgi:hypothetical protein
MVPSIAKPNGTPNGINGHARPNGMGYTASTNVPNGVNGSKESNSSPNTGPKPNGDQSKPKKKLILNAFVEMCTSPSTPP